MAEDEKVPWEEFFEEKTRKHGPILGTLHNISRLFTIPS